MAQLSFNNDPALKALHVAQAERHEAQDMLVSGTFGEMHDGQFRGCSVGCFAHEIDPDSTSFHATVADARALPEWLIRLQDSMFEGLPAAERGSFHVELAKRIPVGVDLAPLPHLIAIARIDRMLVTQRAALSADHPDQVTHAIAQVVSALEVGRRFHEGAAGVDGVESAAESAQSAAQSAARSAWSAAESAARSAWSVARSAQSAMAQSAQSAAESAAWSATESAAQSARSAARSARSAAESAWSAAWSAWSAARSAWSAAESAQSAAESATESAAESAAESVTAEAWSAARSAQSAAAQSARAVAEAAAWIEERAALFSSLSKLEA
ncbi:hypothetical protein [Xanthomonas phage NEB7]|nr:hypothetical protein [Xanthomonas phage NEB7]